MDSNHYPGRLFVSRCVNWGNGWLKVESGNGEQVDRHGGPTYDDISIEDVEENPSFRDGHYLNWCETVYDQP
jgi:hypothetical protein